MSDINETRELAGTLTISRPSTGGVTISVRDEASGARFLEVSISHEEFSQALGALSSRPVSMVVRGLDVVGKTRITERRTVTAPGQAFSRDNWGAWLQENAQEDGWILDTYLGSQHSVGHKDGNTILNYSVFKYVDPEAK